jgi:hypothetical protein
LTFFDRLYIGGGNSQRLGTVPSDVTVVDNNAGILGGIKLWERTEPLPSRAAPRSQRKPAPRKATATKATARSTPRPTAAPVPRVEPAGGEGVSDQPAAAQPSETASEPIGAETTPREA